MRGGYRSHLAALTADFDCGTVGGVENQPAPERVTFAHRMLDLCASPRARSFPAVASARPGMACGQGIPAYAALRAAGATASYLRSAAVFQYGPAAEDLPNDHAHV